MCGIAGIFNFNGQPPERSLIGQMLKAMVHRGPDDSGVWQHEGIAMGHRRLAVIDLAGGHQPMLDPSGNVCLVFNGEIYNYRDLRRELTAAGCCFQTSSDSEVLIHLYLQMGENMLPRLEGMFAFAIYDKRRKTLFLARDRFGQKPLFFACARGQLAFASEIRGLLGIPNLDRSVNSQAVADFLSFQYVPAPETVYHGIRHLPPASFLKVAASDGEPGHPETYWQLDFRTKAGLSFNDAAAQLRELLTAAVAKRLVADVPLGAFLSGGVDSAIITGLMAQLANGPVNTFTIGFNDPRYDERQAARQTARHFGLVGHEKIVDPQQLDILRKMVHHCGQPYADASILPTFLLSQFAREHVTVALSGDGADELFGGYERYQVMNRAQTLMCLPAGIRRVTHRAIKAVAGRQIARDERRHLSRMERFARVLTIPGGAAARYLGILARIDETGCQQLFGERLRSVSELRKPEQALATVLDRMCVSDNREKWAALDLNTYLLNDILVKVDIASMANSLEVRNPFLDHHLAEFAATLPWTFKQCGSQRKRILTAAFPDLLPPGLATRRKRGFGVPLAQWFRGQWQDVLRQVLLDPATGRHGFFQVTAIERMISEHIELRADHSYPLWSMLIFALWCEEFLS